MACVHSATGPSTAGPGTTSARPLGRGRRGSRRPSAAGQPADGCQPDGRARPGGRRPASRPPPRPGRPVQDRDPARSAAAASVTGRCGDPGGQCRRRSAGVVGRTPARVMSSARSLRCTRTRRSSSSRTTTEPAPGRCTRSAAAAWPASAGSTASATSRRSATSTVAGPQPLQQAGGCAAEAVPSLVVAPPASWSRSPAGKGGQRQHAGPFGGAQPDRQDVVLPARGPAHPGGRGRPDGVAGGGHVQLGERRPRGGWRPPGARAGGAARPGRRRRGAPGRSRPASTGRGPAARARRRRRALTALVRRSHRSRDDGYRQRAARIEP